jgi:hypothetical protein
VGERVRETETERTRRRNATTNLKPEPSGKLHPLRLRALGLLLCILVLVGPFATSAFDFRYFSFFFGYFGFF